MDLRLFSLFGLCVYVLCRTPRIKTINQDLFPSTTQNYKISRHISSKIKECNVM